MKTRSKKNDRQSQKPEVSPARSLLSLKDFLYILYLYPFQWLSGKLSVEQIRYLGDLLCRFYGLLYLHKKASLRRALRLGFGLKKNADDIEKIANSFIGNYFLRSMEDVLVNRIPKEELIGNGTITGIENLQKALSRKKGVLLVSNHFFCNRIGKRFLAHKGFPVMSVRNPLSFDPCVGQMGGRFLKKKYSRFLTSIIQDEVSIGEKGFNLKIFRRLRENGLVNVLIDSPYSYKKIYFDFLGQKYSFPAGFLQLAKLSGCAIVPMLCTGNSADFTVRFDKIFELTDSDDPEQFLVANLERLVRIMERQILNYPDQWEFWIRL